MILYLDLLVYLQAQLIAQSIGQAFQVAYMEFLKANGIEDPGLMKEIDYQEVLNQQQIYGEELTMFSNKENQKEVNTPPFYCSNKKSSCRVYKYRTRKWFEIRDIANKKVT